MTDVYLNNRLVGTVDNPETFVSNLIDDRRKGALTTNVNVAYLKDADEIYIENCKGRIQRPLLVVKNGMLLLTDMHIQQLKKNELSWSDLVKQGVIEYLDALEEENALIAFTEQELTNEHTHMEVSPLSLLGLTTSLVPYANHSPTTRINGGSKNQRQAIGLYATNYPLRMDMDVSFLHSPQMPIVQTLMHDLSAYHQHPAGQNVVIAVMSYKGYNMEDAIIFNEASIQRGLGRSTYFRPAIAEELRYAGGLTDEIRIPDKDVKGYKSERDYRLLEDDGIIFPEAEISEPDVLIGRVSPPRFLSGADEYSLSANIERESSLAVAHGEKGTVDAVILTESDEGNKLVQVRVRDQRIPEIGDKFTSRHGQKGVIGLIVKQSDMPFTASGIVPDIIFSPHSIPSRMTLSHMMELLAGKVGALSGRFIDGTIFEGEPEDVLRKELQELGFREDGVETMYNSETGEQMESRIFVGNMYYLKLKHMVANKIHSRALGPVQLLTRQPTEGRAKEGGLRLGEMEKDTFVAHGASLLLKERFDSDKTVIPICEESGLLAIHNILKKRSYCSVAGENVTISNIEVAYAFKLLLDELKAMCIYPKLVLGDKY